MTDSGFQKAEEGGRLFSQTHLNQLLQTPRSQRGNPASEKKLNEIFCSGSAAPEAGKLQSSSMPTAIWLAVTDPGALSNTFSSMKTENKSRFSMQRPSSEELRALVNQRLLTTRPRRQTRENALCSRAPHLPSLETAPTRAWGRPPVLCPSCLLLGGGVDELLALCSASGGWFHGQSHWPTGVRPPDLLCPTSGPPSHGQRPHIQTPVFRDVFLRMTSPAFWKMQKLKSYFNKVRENLQEVEPKYLQLKKPARGSDVPPSWRVTAPLGRRCPERPPWG